MRGWLVAGTAILAAACAPGFGLRSKPGAALRRLPVLLVVEGDSLSAPDTERVAASLARRIDRPVVTAGAPVVEEPVLRRRLAATYGRVPNDGWSSERCAIGRAAAEALAHDGHAHYRLVLRRRGVAHPTAEVERDETSVREVGVDGEMIATTFGPNPSVTRLPVEGVAREVVTGDRTSLRAVTVVADAIAALPPPTYPHWDALARRLLGRGCQLAALAVYDARLRLRPGSRDVLLAALGPVSSGPGVATATPPTSSPPADPAGRLSCKVLCELHMVELCNNDRGLWSRNRAAWRATPCGQMRDEAFLQECYQRQWVTGTLQDACIRPCEHAIDGRARLLHLLQGTGCARMPPS